jgi:hypothetical protein
MLFPRSKPFKLVHAAILAVSCVPALAQALAEPRLAERSAYPIPRDAARAPDGLAPGLPPQEKIDEARRAWPLPPKKPAHPGAPGSLIPHSESPARPGETPGVKPRPNNLEKAQAKGSLETPTDGRTRSHAADQTHVDSTDTATYLDWTKVHQDPSGLFWTATESNEGGSAQRSLRSAELEELFHSGATVVSSGDVPNGPQWRDFTKGYPGQVVTHEPESANRDRRAIAEAVALGDKPIDLATVKVFNALPQETDFEPSVKERGLMQIGGTTRAWELINQRIIAASAGFSSEVATRKALLDELQYGNSSVIVVYAHFDGNQLYMPGSNGQTVTVDDIAKIVRTRDSRVASRVIVLAACSTAAKPPNTRSLTSVLLQKGIARTVWATDHPYDARDIPDLLKRLKAQTPLRKAGGQLQQYVNLHFSNRLPGPLPRSLLTWREKDG